MKARVIKKGDHYAIQFLNDIEMVIGEYPVTDIEIANEVLAEQRV